MPNKYVTRKFELFELAFVQVKCDTRKEGNGFSLSLRFSCRTPTRMLMSEEETKKKIENVEKFSLQSIDYHVQTIASIHLTFASS